MKTELFVVIAGYSKLAHMNQKQLEEPRDVYLKAIIQYANNLKAYIDLFEEQHPLVTFKDEQLSNIKMGVKQIHVDLHTISIETIDDAH